MAYIRPITDRERKERHILTNVLLILILIGIVIIIILMLFWWKWLGIAYGARAFVGDKAIGTPGNVYINTCCDGSITPTPCIPDKPEETCESRCKNKYANDESA